MAFAAVARRIKARAQTAAPDLSRDTKQAVACRGMGVRFFTDRRSVTALSGIDLDVTRGEFVTLLGPSGCGKSTLLRAVADLVPPSGGDIRILGGTARAARRRRDIGFVFQDPALLPWRSALANVALPLEVANGAKHKGKATPAELLELVGLKGWEHAYPHELSGGMRQRVAIARALVSDPQILLMDEPFGALDEITRLDMQGELLRVWQSRRKTVVFVTHSIMESLVLGDRVVVMGGGGIAAIHDVDIERPRSRSDPALLQLHDAIWQGLH